MPERVITDTPALVAFCRRLADAEFITVDTEFMREKTYWPRLCLVQVGGPDEARAVDALADGIDLAPLFDLLANPNVLKVFHAARQDMEIFALSMDRLPAPLFDTQVAAMVCGFGDSVGYETLVAKLAKARVDKSSRFTDWSLRPLSQRQIDYALGDVTHLRVVYEKLARKLAANGHESWLGEEMALLNSPETYAPDPMLAFRRLKVRNPSRRTLALLRELAAWRELEARRVDVPRNRVLRDEALLEIAHHAPTTVDDLKRTRGLGRRMAEGPAGQAILEAVRRGQAVPDADCPRPQSKPGLPRGLGPVVDLLKVLLKMKCEENQVAQKLVASAADVERIAADGETADVPALRGWRREVFGDDALRLRGGATALAADGKRLKLVTLGSD
ncbi:MAG: ribonuclease D [Rhodospirillales bacterium]|jgi:ribonuclease D|nr:ribonuclease D [Rhodospirillales bacterium]MDP6882876.1 ribonuclease D [Rhodospirillales bacterium]